MAIGVVLSACGDDGGNSQQRDAAIDGSNGGSVSGVAHMLHGAMVPAAVNALPPVPAPPSDGHWYVTPDEAKVTIERINFAGANGGTSTGADLTNCSLTFSKSTPSLSNLLDCPFSIAPGTYSGMTVHINGTFDVKVADATNGIYTDPASSTKLSTTEPGGGPAFVAYTRPLGGTGVEQAFATPLTVNEGDTISLAVVLDAIQTLRVTVTSSGSSLAFGDLNQIPVNIFPTLTTPGIARYLTTSATAASYNDDLVLANIVRVYDAAGGGQPVYLMTEQTAGAINGCSTPAPAYPVDPAMSSPLPSGARLGGWLGRDSAQTTCWAVPNDIAYATYRAYFTLGNAAAVGDTATLSCAATTSPTPPTTGSTYASGCPSLTPDATATLTLVAE